MGTKGGSHQSRGRERPAGDGHGGEPGRQETRGELSAAEPERPLGPACSVWPAQRVRGAFPRGRPTLQTHLYPPRCVPDNQLPWQSRDRLNENFLPAALKPSRGQSTEHHSCIIGDYALEQPTDNSCSLTNQVLGFKPSSWDLPGGPAVKTLHFHCRGHGFDPWSGN